MKNRFSNWYLKCPKLKTIEICTRKWSRKKIKKLCSQHFLHPQINLYWGDIKSFKKKLSTYTYTYTTFKIEKLLDCVSSAFSWGRLWNNTGMLMMKLDEFKNPLAFWWMKMTVWLIIFSTSSPHLKQFNLKSFHSFWGEYEGYRNFARIFFPRIESISNEPILFFENPFHKKKLLEKIHKVLLI